MTYKSVIDTSNKNNSHTICIDFIDENFFRTDLKILDVGCSEGYLGAYLRSIGHQVTGVEINPSAAEKAKNLLERVYCGTIQDFFKENLEEKFDVIIYGDVLEHITDPKEVLDTSYSRLTEDGVVIASIPNVAHYSVRAMLLEGRWEYKTLGILDRTHVKFYTEKSAVELFDSANFHVSKIGKVKLDAKLVGEISDISLREDLIEVAKSVNPYDESGEVFQYILLGDKKDKSLKKANLNVVVYAPLLDHALFDIRLKTPLTEWAKRFNGLVRFRFFCDIRLEDLYWGDVFIFQRIGTSYINDLIETLKAHDKKVVFEIDDLLLDLPEFLKHHFTSEDSLNALSKAIEISDCVSTTTQRLSSELQKLNSNVICTPNYLTHIKRERQEYLFHSEEKSNLIIASSDQVLMDFIVPALLKIQDIFDSKINIVVIGPPADYLEKAGLRVIKKDMLPYREFWNFISNISNPIGIIPLDASLFSSCKSPIKYFDYTIAGIPVICSNVPPYSDVITNGNNGVLAENTSKDWIEKISLLLNQPEKRVELLSNAKSFVKNNFTREFSSDQWNHIFSSLDIKRVDHPELLNPDTYTSNKVKVVNQSGSDVIVPRVKITKVIKAFLSPHYYKKALKIVRNEGVKGLLKRVYKLF